METIRYLLSVVIRLTIGLLFLAFVLWLIGFIYPTFSLKNIFSTDTFSKEWLPAPRNISLTNANNNKRNVFVPGPSYNNYASQPGVEFVVYTDEGKRVIRASDSAVMPAPNGNTGVYADTSLYVRNMSIYANGSIYYGQDIVGEARDTMFRNNIFNILIVGQDGRLIAVAPAINTGSWSVPGWNRWKATIPTRLPANTYCRLVFQSANQPLQVGMPVRCN